MTQFAPSDNEAWGLGWALGQALSPTQDAAISGYLSQLYLVPVTPSPVPGAQAFVAQPAPAGTTPPTANALNTLKATKAAQPDARFFANPATASTTHVDVLVSLNPNVTATIAAPGSAWGELTISGGAAPAAAPTKKSQNTSILVGALVGGALGAALGGPVGAIGGGVVGGFVGNAISKKA